MDRMVASRLGQLLILLVCGLIILKTDGYYVDITYVDSAVAKGAGENDSNSQFSFLVYSEFVNLL